MKDPVSKEVATVSSAGTALAAPLDMSEFAGMGLQHIDPSKLSLPFLKVIQAGSPQIKPKNEKFIAGAAMGMILNTLTGDLFAGDAGIRVIICSIQSRDLLWAPAAESIGRPLASYPFGHADTPEFEIVQNSEGKKIRQLKDGSDNYLVETDEYYVLRVAEDGHVEPGVIAMDSSDLGCSRKIKSQIYNKVVVQNGRSFKAPLFGQFYKMTSTDKSNAQHDWMIWKSEFAGLLGQEDEDLLKQAYAFYNAVEPKQDQVIITESAVNAAPVEKKEVPF